MSTLEQFMDALCPFMGQEVPIRIIYNCSNTMLCQINIEAAFYECLLSDKCSGYKTKDQSCLLFHFHASDED